MAKTRAKRAPVATLAGAVSLEDAFQQGTALLVFYDGSGSAF